jgi:hypothetical protein
MENIFSIWAQITFLGVGIARAGGGCWNATIKLPPYNFSCWLKNRAGTSVAHPLPASVTFRIAGNQCYRCVSMMGVEGCPTSVGGVLQQTVGAHLEAEGNYNRVCVKDGQLTVVATDAPLYLLLAGYQTPTPPSLQASHVRWPTQGHGGFDISTGATNRVSWKTDDGGGGARSRGIISVPHLSGIFVNIDRVSEVWTAADWLADLSVMKAIGIEFFIIHHVARATVAADAACPLGHYSSYYTPTEPPRTGPCIQPKLGPAGMALGVVLDAAAELGLGVYLGFAMTAAPLFVDRGRAMNTTTLAQYTAMCEHIGQDVWAVHGQRHHATLRGWYTMLEEWNDPMWSAAALVWAGQFLGPLAQTLKTQLPPAGGSSSHTTVFSSPYYVGNQTRRPAAKFGDLNPKKNAAVWNKFLPRGLRSWTLSRPKMRWVLRATASLMSQTTWVTSPTPLARRVGPSGPTWSFSKCTISAVAIPRRSHAL